uniref:Uncharacterized protein n=1 Tax=viral metagenome TaxID=1070528 RepID=A0A6M3LR58_9ZZZZ
MRNVKYRVKDKFLDKVTDLPFYRVQGHVEGRVWVHGWKLVWLPVWIHLVRRLRKD